MVRRSRTPGLNNSGAGSAVTGEPAKFLERIKASSARYSCYIVLYYYDRGWQVLWFAYRYHMPPCDVIVDTWHL